MSNARKKHQATSGERPGSGLAQRAKRDRSQTEPESHNPAPRRRALFRLLLILSPILLLVVIELLLRAFGVGYPSTLFLPWRQGGTNLWVSNSQFTRRFFPLAFAPQPRAFAFPDQKETNTTRIFILGESAALGEPEPKFGFGPMLRALLRDRFPARRFEVVNLGIVAINSHVIREIAREAKSRQGDIWVVYMGNNEIVGPFGSATVMGAQAPSLTMARASLALKKTRVGQVLDRAMRIWRPANDSQTEWHGMATFQENRVRYDDPRTERVHLNFEKNLQEILEAGRSSGALVLLCTVGTNLKDCPPFASLHPPRMPVEQLARWQADYDRGRKAELEGKFEEALGVYREAVKTDATYADLQFHLGRCLLALGQPGEARHHFEDARDYDALQFRADHSINEAVRRQAAAFSSAGGRLVDLEQILAQQSPAGIVGGELFLEHVHLNPEGNYRVARTLAGEMEAALSPPLRDGSAAVSPEWLSQSDCFAAIGFTPFQRHELLSLIEQLVSNPPFNPADNAALLQRLKEEIDKLRAATKASRVRMTIPDLRQRVDRYPGDPDLRSILAEALETVSDYAAAEAECKVVTHLLPQSAAGFLKLGYEQEQQGRIDDAFTSYRTCLLRDANYGPGHEQLGLLLFKQGRYKESISHLRYALRAHPEKVEIRLKLDRALASTGDKDASMQELKEVLRIDPKNTETLHMIEAAKAPK